ncbi:MAG: hypothetical protein CMA77_02635 [Euryarchaeota archaeon]|nr:hypothetical protein [Euryarchaeota archaeon]|tara:strand:+ start:1987 stop:2790 length:804 start_codon:yes stop_codon:yes gene_type:complete
MFGMDDPVKVLNQLRHYVADGRLEIAEVMAEELTNLLLSKWSSKNRTLENQELLVLALRDYANILEIRQKWKKCLNATKKLKKEVRSLDGFRGKSGLPITQEQTILKLQDQIQMGRVFLQFNKLRKSIKCFSRAANAGHIEAHLLSIEAYEKCKGNLKKATKVAKSLDKTLESIGPLSREQNEFVLISDNGLTTSYQRIASSLERWVQPSSGLNKNVAESLARRLASLNSQKAAIESGEQAANARLQSAIDSLQPTVDYHEYSQSSR